MKKILSLLLLMAMCFSLVACGSGNETSSNNEPQADASVSQQEVAQPDAPAENNEPQTNETVSQEKTEENPEDAPNNEKTEKIVATMTAEYLVGVWVWQKDMSSDIIKTRDFELYADGTGKILSSAEESWVSATFKWSIENEKLIWTSVSIPEFGQYTLELSDNYLTDLTWSEFYLKETN